MLLVTITKIRNSDTTRALVEPYKMSQVEQNSEPNHEFLRDFIYNSDRVFRKFLKEG